MQHHSTAIFLLFAQEYVGAHIAERCRIESEATLFPGGVQGESTAAILTSADVHHFPICQLTDNEPCLKVHDLHLDARYRDPSTPLQGDVYPARKYGVDTARPC